MDDWSVVIDHLNTVYRMIGIDVLFPWPSIHHTVVVSAQLHNHHQRRRLLGFPFTIKPSIDRVEPFIIFTDRSIDLYVSGSFNQPTANSYWCPPIIDFHRLNGGLEENKKAVTGFNSKNREKIQRNTTITTSSYCFTTTVDNGN